MNFKEFAIQSADIYFQFVRNGQKRDRPLGMDECKVRSITRDGDYFTLSLNKQLWDVEYIIFRVDLEGGKKDYTKEKIKPVVYDRDSMTLKVRPNDDLLDLFSALNPENLSLLSDLTFLIQRVSEWYGRYGDLLTLPSRSPCISVPTFTELKQLPSDEQAAAVKGALTAVSRQQLMLQAAFLYPLQSYVENSHTIHKKEL